jgi:hypothetical protein
MGNTEVPEYWSTRYVDYALRVYTIYVIRLLGILVVAP